MMRTVVISLVVMVSACGDARDLQQAKQEVIQLGEQTLEAAGGAVDTRTACVLAGQSAAFCACIQERLGPDAGEHAEAIATVVRDTLTGQSLEVATESAEGLTPATREALVQCATRAAIQEAAAEAGN